MSCGQVDGKKQYKWKPWLVWLGYQEVSVNHCSENDNEITQLMKVYTNICQCLALIFKILKEMFPHFHILVFLKIPNQFTRQ